MWVTIVLNCALLLGAGVPNASGAVGQTRVIQRIPKLFSSLFDSAQFHVSSNGRVYVLVGYFGYPAQYYHLHTIRDDEWSETAVGLTGDVVPDVHAVMADDRYYLYMFSGTRLEVYRTLEDISEDHPLWRAPAKQGSGGELIPLAVDRGDVLLLNSERCWVPDPITSWVMGVLSFGHSGYTWRLCSVSIRNARFQSARWRPGPVENLKFDLSKGWLLENECLHVAWETGEVGCFYATIKVKDNSWERPILLDEGRCNCPSVGRQGESIYCAWYHADERIDVARITGGKVTLLPGEQRGCGPRLVQVRDGRLILFWLNERGVNYRWCTEDGTGPVYGLPGPVDPDPHHGGRDVERFFHVVAAESGDLHILSARDYDSPLDARAGHEEGLEIRYTLIPAEALQKTAPR